MNDPQSILADAIAELGQLHTERNDAQREIEQWVQLARQVTTAVQHAKSTLSQPSSPAPAPAAALEKVCSRCGLSLSAEAKFCRVCGGPAVERAASSPALAACPHCGQPMKNATAKFCGHCGGILHP